MTTTNQSWDPDAYARNARFVSDLGAPVLELLAPHAGERILDLGCGDARSRLNSLKWDATSSASIQALPR
jgi:trans-aconitate methyltransferase